MSRVELSEGAFPSPSKEQLEKRDTKGLHAHSTRFTTDGPFTEVLEPEGDYGVNLRVLYGPFTRIGFGKPSSTMRN